MNQIIIRYNPETQCEHFPECKVDYKESIIGSNKTISCMRCIEVLSREILDKPKKEDKQRTVKKKIKNHNPNGLVKEKIERTGIVLNTVYHENNIETMARMDDNTVDYIFTSPPYNVVSSPNGDKYEKNEEYTDALSQQEYYDIRVAELTEMLRVTKNHVFYNIQPLRGNKVALPMIVSEFATNLKETIIWDKGKMAPSQVEGVMMSGWEYIFVFSKIEPEYRVFRDFSDGVDLRGVPNIIKIHPKHNPDADVNKAVFPIELPLWFITRFGNPGNIWYDPFFGTGTTGRAADRMDRKWIGSEIDENCVKRSRDKLSLKEINWNDYGSK